MFFKAAKALASQLGFSSAQVEEEDRFILKSQREILFVLREVMKDGAFVTIQFGHAQECLLSTLLSVSENALVLDHGASEPLNRKALASNKLLFISKHHRVKIQFSCTGMRSVTYEGRLAFQVSLPGSMIRLQRRENYRLLTPGYRPVKCLFPIGEGRFPQTAMEATVLDISNGGIAVLSPPRGVVLSVGSVHQNCRIVLPDAGNIHASVQVRSVSNLPLKNGDQVKRIGCQFRDLDTASMNIIQRYILENDRERRAQEAGW